MSISLYSVFWRLGGEKNPVECTSTVHSPIDCCQPVSFPEETIWLICCPQIQSGHQRDTDFITVLLVGEVKVRLISICAGGFFK